MLLNKRRNDRKLMSIAPDKIVPSPYQPRRDFDYYELLELSASIQKNGLIQPITVRKKGEYFELISGERRLRACVFAGLKSIPCIVVTAGDRECSLMCLIENIQRTDLNFFEEADGIKRLMNDFALSRQEVAEKLGIAQSTLSNKLRLLRFTVEQREKIVSSGLSERHARALLRLPEDDRDNALNRVIAQQLTVADTEDMVCSMLIPKDYDRNAVRKGKVSDLRIYFNSISKIVDTIRSSGLDAYSKKSENEEFIEYTITIPKRKLTV